MRFSNEGSKVAAKRHSVGSRSIKGVAFCLECFACIKNFLFGHKSQRRPRRLLLPGLEGRDRVHKLKDLQHSGAKRLLQGLVCRTHEVETPSISSTITARHATHGPNVGWMLRCVSWSRNAQPEISATRCIATSLSPPSNEYHVATAVPHDAVAVDIASRV